MQQRLTDEFLEKSWTKRGVNKLLKKLRDTGTVDRRPGSSRPRSARTEENVETLSDLVLSQEDEPRTHRTVREISQETGIHRSSVSQIICFVRTCVWNVSRGGVHRSWPTVTVLLARSTLFCFRSCSSLPLTLSSLQTKRCSQLLHVPDNRQNDCVYAPHDTRKHSIATERF